MMRRWRARDGRQITFAKCLRSETRTPTRLNRDNPMHQDRPLCRGVSIQDASHREGVLPPVHGTPQPPAECP